MAQLKTTTVTGDLTVSGKAVCSTAPTSNSHLANKAYVDSHITVSEHYYTPIAYNSLQPGDWRYFTTDAFNITLTKGKYYITYSVSATVGSNGSITTRLVGADGQEMYGLVDRATVGCSNAMWNTANCSFVFTVDKAEENWQIKPQIYGNVWSTGQHCQIFIMKLNNN